MQIDPDMPLGERVRRASYNAGLEKLEERERELVKKESDEAVGRVQVTLPYGPPTVGESVAESAYQQCANMAYLVELLKVETDRVRSYRPAGDVLDEVRAVRDWVSDAPAGLSMLDVIRRLSELLEDFDG